MRSAVCIFGLICGAIVIWTVGNFGYATADDPAAKWNMAFLFGVVATAGLFGHAVSIRLWRINRFWSAVTFLACAAALVINLSNSLGALAGRNSKGEAEVTSKVVAIKADKDELARLQKQLDALGKFDLTDIAAVAAAQRAADAATRARKAECGDGDPKQRGKFCRAYETTETEANTVLARATAAKATTHRATEIENEMRPVRERLRTAGTVEKTNVQGHALAKLFGLPDSEAGFAAVLQNVLLAGVVEAIIVLSLVAAELLRPFKQSSPAPETACEMKIKVPDKPKLVAARDARPAGSLIPILTAALERAEGERVDFADAYRAYVAGCKAEGSPVLRLDAFAEGLRRFCEVCSIPVRRAGTTAYLLNVRCVSNPDARPTAQTA